MLQPIRIVHTADLHLGTSFRSFPDQAGRLRDEQLAHFARLVSYCTDQRVDVLLIAGDLFDQPQPATQLVRTVAELLATLQETKVFIAAGNHDPAFIDSPYRSLTWPDNVHCFTDAFESVELVQWPVRVHGAGFTASAAPASLLPARTAPAAADRLNLLVLHADLVSRGQASAYNPVSLDQLGLTGMDYTALGHRHDSTALLTAGTGAVAYSGCPLGRGFDETGPRSIRRIDFTQADTLRPYGSTWTCRTESVALGGRVFHETVVSIGACTTHDEIADRILMQVRAADPVGWSENIYRILLCGELDEGFAFVPAIINQVLARQMFHIEIIDETERKLDLAALAKEVSLRGTFVRMMTARLDSAIRQGRNDEAALVKRALSFGLEAFSGEVKQHAHS